MNEQKLAIVFDGPPSHESGRFVEVELDGASISFGEWQENGEYWELVLPEPFSALAASETSLEQHKQVGAMLIHERDEIIEDFRNMNDELRAKLAEYENDETPTRRELALVKRKLEAMKQALVEISEQEDELCSYCAGSGGRYADGGAHYPSENAPVVPCGQCGGSGKMPPPDARDLAASALATPNVEVSF